jgi:hypothetical protein
MERSISLVKNIGNYSSYYTKGNYTFVLINLVKQQDGKYMVTAERTNGVTHNNEYRVLNIPESDTEEEYNRAIRSYKVRGFVEKDAIML